MTGLSPQGKRGRSIHQRAPRDSHVGRACSDCNGSTICIYHDRKLQPDSDVLRIHILYVMDTFSIHHEREPRLHDGRVTEDTDKYWLLRIPPSGREPSDVELTRIRKAPRTQPSQAKSGKMQLHVNVHANRHTSEPRPFVCCSKWRRVRTSQNRIKPKLPLLPVCKQTG